jgi:2,4-diaminopentanoate dehydrogenase
MAFEASLDARSVSGLSQFAGVTRVENVRVVIWGFGAMGSGMARMILAKKGIDVVAVCDHAPDRCGKDMHEVLSVERGDSPKVLIADRPEQVIAKGMADVLLLATGSTTADCFEKIIYGLEQGMNVITTAEELAYPQAQQPELARQIDQAAKRHKVTVLGTGINPGFVMDYLVLAMTGACEQVDHIQATRVNDLSPFGPAVMKGQGVGVSVDEFSQGVSDGNIVGHVGFPESIRMIADGIGWNVEKIGENREAIVSTTQRKTGHVEVASGDVAGCRQTGIGYVEGDRKIEMVHPQQILPELEGVETGDFIHIKGTPDISLSIKPEIPGGTGTIAMCVNMIPQVINAEPGMVTMLDLPVPRAVMGDFRDAVRDDRRPAH